MANDYMVALRITVVKGTPESLVVQEESSFPNITFGKMTRLSAEFYDLITKLQKEKT